MTNMIQDIKGHTAPVEVASFCGNLERLTEEQHERREQFLNDPANAELVRQTRQRMALAKKLYDARHRAGLTQKQVAVRMHVSQPVVARLERARGSITTDTLAKYADACGCELVITFN